MDEALNSLISCMSKGDEVIVSGFGIDEKVIYAMLERKLGQIRTLRLVYQHQMLANPGFVQQMCLNNSYEVRIIHTPIFISRASRGICSVFHSKIIAVKGSRNGKIKWIGIPSFNWTPYHFSSRRSVFDSFIVFEGKRVQNLEQFLDLPEFSARRDKVLMKIPPRLLIFEANKEGEVKFSIESHHISKAIRKHVPAKVEVLAAPHINTMGLNLLLGADRFDSIRDIILYSASSKKGDRRLHAKILIGADGGGRQCLWLGSMNFTQNAVSGNNHEILVVLNEGPSANVIRSKLEEFEYWRQDNEDRRDPEEDEPGIASVPNELAPTYAELIEVKGIPFVRVLFPGQTQLQIKQFRLIPPRGEDVLIKSRISKLTASIDLPLLSQEANDEKVREALSSMYKTGTGRVGMEINHKGVEVELDLGILWDLAQGVGLPLYKDSKMKKESSEPRGDWVPYFSGTDVRPLRALSSIGNKKSTRFLDWLLNNGKGEIVEWVKDWRRDPWSKNE